MKHFFPGEENICLVFLFRALANDKDRHPQVTGLHTCEHANVSEDLDL